MGLRPNTEVVATAMLLKMPGMPDAVSTELPKPDVNGNVTWADTGFVRVGRIFENIDMYNTIREAVITLECWFVVPGSTKPPYPRAANLAETIVAATLPFNVDAIKGNLTNMPSRYDLARVLDVTLVNGPRRDERPEYANRAMYMVDIRLVWVALPAA